MLQVKVKKRKEIQANYKILEQLIKIKILQKLLNSNKQVNKKFRLRKMKIEK